MDFDDIFYSLRNGFPDIQNILGPVIAIVIIAAVISYIRKGRRPVIILQEFIFNEHEDVFLIIKGRASGFWNWVLSLFDKAPIYRFTFNKRLLKYETSTKIKYYIPIIKISCISSRMTNKLRIVWLILGLIFFIAGLVLSPDAVKDTDMIVPVISLVIVGIILFLCSLIKKKSMRIGVYLFDNNAFISLTFVKGIINSIDNETFDAAINTLNRIVLANAISK